mgnify:CR=1 FL=1
MVANEAVEKVGNDSTSRRFFIFYNGRNIALGCHFLQRFLLIALTFHFVVFNQQ